jgi:hypothetical protein
MPMGYTDFTDDELQGYSMGRPAQLFAMLIEDSAEAEGWPQVNKRYETVGWATEPDDELVARLDRAIASVLQEACRRETVEAVCDAFPYRLTPDTIDEWLEAHGATRQ